VFASLSAYEGMPIAMVETLSFGLSVVLSDIPAHHHFIQTYDVAGELVGDDPTEVGAAVNRLAGRESDVTLPEWGEVAERYLDMVCG
jgi:glycosyltransferase involved in cell wall biosynthesis